MGLMKKLVRLIDRMVVVQLELHLASEQFNPFILLNILRPLPHYHHIWQTFSVDVYYP